MTSSEDGPASRASEHRLQETQPSQPAPAPAGRPDWTRRIRVRVLGSWLGAQHALPGAAGGPGGRRRRYLPGMTGMAHGMRLEHGRLACTVSGFSDLRQAGGRGGCRLPTLVLGASESAL